MSDVDNIIAMAKNQELTSTQVNVLIAEIERLRIHRRNLFDAVSSWKMPLFELRMQTIKVQGKIDDQIYELRKAWFDEHGYPLEKVK